MNVPRNQITVALFNLLFAAYPWRKAEQIPSPIDNVDAADQPYMAIICPQERPTQPQALGLTAWSQEWAVVIYLRRDAIPDLITVAKQIDDIKDALDRALAGPNPGMAQTLGGLVTNCKLVRIVEAPGIIYPQMAFIGDIDILTGV